MPPERLVSVSVDLDAVACYHRIHALPAPDPTPTRFAILRRCLPRFAALFDRHGIRATFFVVGQDLLEDGDGAALLSQLGSSGHELANHSHTHPYDLTRLDTARIDAEIARAHDAIEACAKRPPVGFRSPGYETSATLIGLLEARGYHYDSSTFPSIPYYLAKAAVMGVIRLTGRQSGSILGSPSVLAAPTTPYHPHRDNAYRRGERRLLELPMTVTPWLRLPVIGTLLITAPPWLRKRLVQSACHQSFFNLELHGIDLADADTDDYAPALRAKQPDLRVPLSRKIGALDATLTELKQAGYRFTTLAEAAHAIGTEGRGST